MHFAAWLVLFQADESAKVYAKQVIEDQTDSQLVQESTAPLAHAAKRLEEVLATARKGIFADVRKNA